MKICVIGAGNIGTYLAAYISMKGDHRVWLHTTKPNLFKENMILIEEEKDLRHSVKIHSVTDSLEDAVTDSDYVLITYPSFMVKDTLNKINPYVKKGARIGVIPGFGGKEYCIDELLEKGCIFFGTQRVPSIVRLEKYGETVNLKQ
ncbi:MAG: 2-dehydropantoate 2-reductase N-terminal domain-containing protein, partial [Clostridium perfringens]|nr:2-dehydropantoate 2-reductase N-terminal domain-containing protein [Clostridium perfringens]